VSGPWIKVCGITTPEAVNAAAGAGVDAVGFVFAESPRRVTPERAFRLAASVRGKVACCAVVRRTSQAEVDEILRVLDSMQLTAKHKVATPANWKQGQDVIIAGSVNDEDAKKLFPQGWKAPKPYLRITRQPK